MSESKDQNLLKIAQKVNLDSDDMKAIKRNRKFQRIQYWKLAIFSFFMGFLGGWVFMSYREYERNAGYPISQILIGVNLTSQIRTSKGGKSLLLVASLIILAITGFISGGTLGTFFHPIFNVIPPPRTTLYGVYSNQGA